MNALSVFLLSSLSASIVYGYTYTLWQAKELPVGRLEQNAAGEFKLSMTKTAGTRNYTIAIGRTPDVKVPAQYKLAFRMRGGATNKNTFVSMHILTDPGSSKPWITHYGPSLTSDNRDWRLHVLSLDSDFHLSDALWTITQVKFHLHGEDNPNADSSIEVKDVRFVSAEDLGAAGAAYRVEGHQRARAAGKPLVKVYFDLDNEDREAFLIMKDKSKRVEKNLYDGFAGYLLSGVDGRVHGPETAVLSGMYSDVSLPRLNCCLIGESDTPQEADVIVYSRACADPSRPHVYPGKKMIVFGCAADEDVKQVLPVVQTYLDGHDYAERLPVKAVGTHPVLENDALSGTRFGVYQSMQLRDNARRVLDFVDGRPCVVENAQCMVVATGLGAQLLPDEWFFDRFLLKAILYLGGHADQYSTMDALRDILVKWRKHAVVEHVLREAGIADTNGWRPGASCYNFGRFGYNTGEGLLCYSQRRDLGLENGSCSFRMDIPQSLLESEPQATPVLRVTAVNWTNKSYLLTRGSWQYGMDISLLSPFVRYRIPLRTMDLTLENAAERAVYETASGWQQVKLADVQDLPDMATLKRPWVLLYCEGETRPLQLVFMHRPKAVKTLAEDGSVTALRLELDAPQTILCGWPFGMADIPTQTWSAGLADDLTRQLDQAAAMAFGFPEGCDEIFKIDRVASRIHILQRTAQSPHHDTNDWGVKPLSYSLMPPLMAAARQENLLVECKEPLVRLHQSSLGPLWAVMGTSVLRYSLPLPSADDDIMTPGFVSDDVWLKEANDAFVGGNRWSWGGGGRYEWLTFGKPGGPRGGDNMNPFSWLLGVPTMLQGYFMYTEENRAKVRERVNHRYVECVDQYQYKYLARHRTEPFSGLQYPVMFRSLYPLGVTYADGVGTGYNYGDCNEAVTQFIWSGELLAERFGMASLVQANWPFYRYVMRYQTVMEDWAYHAGSCREDGAGAWIDMLNGEYSGMISYARLARLCGDKPEEEEALYRAAKRMVPTLLRLRFHTVLGDAADPKSPARRYSLVTGFGEYGVKTYPNPLHVNSNVTAAMDLFDFSQGAPGSLFRLYQAYVLPDIHSYLENFAIPALTASGRFNANERYIQALAYFTTPAMKPFQWTDDIIAAKRTFWTQDWPGITAAYPLSLMMARKVNAPLVTVCREANVREMLYQVQQKRLHMRVEATVETVMELTKPHRLTINDKRLDVPAGNMPLRLPLIPGVNVILAEY